MTLYFLKLEKKLVNCKVIQLMIMVRLSKKWPDLRPPGSPLTPGTICDMPANKAYRAYGVQLDQVSPLVQCAVPVPARWRRHTEANMKNNKEKKDHRNTNHTQKEAKTQSLPVNALSRFLTSHAVNRGFDRPSCKRQVPTQTLTVLRYFRVVLSLLKVS